MIDSAPRSFDLAVFDLQIGDHSPPQSSDFAEFAIRVVDSAHHAFDSAGLGLQMGDSAPRSFDFDELGLQIRDDSDRTAGTADLLERAAGQTAAEMLAAVEVFSGTVPETFAHILL